VTVGRPHGRHAVEGRCVRHHLYSHPCLYRTSDFVHNPDHGPYHGHGLDRGRVRHAFESGIHNDSLWRSRASLNGVVCEMGGSLYRALGRGRSGPPDFHSGSADPR